MTLLNLGCGPNPLDGFVNLDLPDWRFEDGLPYPDESIEAITVSHALMYVDQEFWPFVFSEFARVLEPRGVVRITEDATDDPKSQRFGGFHEAVTLTTADLVLSHIGDAGMFGFLMNDDGVSQTTMFRDFSLCQSWHGKPPKVFFVEGLKG